MARAGYTPAVQATTDARGNVTFTFPYPTDQSFGCVGSVQVASGPLGAFSINLDGNPFGAGWSGATSYGPFSFQGSQKLQIVGSGLLPNTTYTATFNGYVAPLEETDILIPPSGVQLSGTANILFQTGIAIVAGQSLTFSVPQWAQAIAFRWTRQSGTATGLQVQPVDVVTGAILQGLWCGPNQWLYIPVNGRTTSLTLNPLLSKGQGGTITSATVIVQALAGPLIIPQLGIKENTPSAAQGLVQEVTVPNNSVIAFAAPLGLAPDTGMCFRLKNFHARATIATTAGGRVLLQGLVSLVNYAAWESPGALPVSVDIDMEQTVAAGVASGVVDPTEGLSVSNQGTGQSITAGVTYDYVPFPFA